MRSRSLHNQCVSWTTCFIHRAFLLRLHPYYRSVDTIGAAALQVHATAQRSLKQRHQPTLPARVAVNIALRHLDRLVPGQQLHVAQAAAGLVRISRRGGNEAAPP